MPWTCINVGMIRNRFQRQSVPTIASLATVDEAGLYQQREQSAAAHTLTYRHTLPLDCNLDFSVDCVNSGESNVDINQNIRAATATVT